MYGVVILLVVVIIAAFLLSARQPVVIESFVSADTPHENASGGNFGRLQRQRTIPIKFYTDNCAQCKLLAATLKIALEEPSAGAPLAAGRPYELTLEQIVPTADILVEDGNLRDIGPGELHADIYKLDARNKLHRYGGPADHAMMRRWIFAAAD